MRKPKSKNLPQKAMQRDRAIYPKYAQPAKNDIGYKKAI
jgi:hypothetical protein